MAFQRQKKTETIKNMRASVCRRGLAVASSRSRRRTIADTGEVLSKRRRVVHGTRPMPRKPPR